MDEGSVRRAVARFGGMGWPRRASRGAGCDGAGREDGALETAAQRTCALSPKARARRRADERRRTFFYDPQLCVSRENPRFALSFVRSRSCGKCFGFGEAARSAAENFCSRWASIARDGRRSCQSSTSRAMVRASRRQAVPAPPLARGMPFGALGNMAKLHLCSLCGSLELPLFNRSASESPRFRRGYAPLDYGAVPPPSRILGRPGNPRLRTRIKKRRNPRDALPPCGALR